jgi:hypothetical protein
MRDSKDTGMLNLQNVFKDSAQLMVAVLAYIFSLLSLFLYMFG